MRLAFEINRGRRYSNCLAFHSLLNFEMKSLAVQSEWLRLIDAEIIFSDDLSEYRKIERYDDSVPRRRSEGSRRRRTVTM